MPLYEYRCENCGKRFEVLQKFSDAPLTAHAECGGGPVEKLISTSALQFKGSGWYVNDYGKGSNGEGKAEAKSRSEAESKAESKSESKSDSKSESKSDSKSESKSDSKSESKSESKPKSESKSESKSDSSTSTPSTPKPA